MILLGPIAGLVLGLTRVDRAIALPATVVLALLGGAMLGVAAWSDSHELSIGYWISLVVFTAISVALFLGARAVRSRSRGDQPTR